MKSKSILVLLGVMMLYATGALATGINVLIDDSGIKKLDGTAISIDNFHPYYDHNKLEFFLDLPAPTSSTGKLQVTANQYTKIGATHKYQLASYNGGTLYVRAWKDTPNAQGSYYGKTSSAIASGTTLPYDFSITDLRTIYKADKPFAPAIGSISESMQRTGNSQVLQLVVPVSYNDTGADGTKIETTGFSVIIVYPNGSSETRGGSSVTLNNTQAGSYKFTPVATNWYGSTTGAEVPYATLGGGGGALPAFTYYFYPPAATGNVVPTTMCINSLSLTKPTAASITKAADLSAVINNANNKKIVSAICKGDAASGTLSTALFDANGGIVDPLTNFNLTAGEPVQVYVTATGSVEIQ